MVAPLGNLLVSARIRQGLSQEAVAHLARVKQQTVSRWERGLSRPRGETLRRLAVALDIRESEIEEAVYGATSDRSPEALPPEPARPLTAKLPLGTLTDEQFEEFVADLLERKHPDADVHLLGERGDDQKGYDVLMTHPDGRR